ncbi:MAG TPA: hypothetical protein VK507_03195, partial [Iamia sp.]|nr:hypothetical protein [Iamia sp.]
LGTPIERGAAHDRAVAALGAAVVLQPGQDPADVLGGGDGPVEVTGEVDGYRLGRAYVIRRDGIVYLIEVDGGQTADDAVREIEEDIEPDIERLEGEATQVDVDGTIRQIWSLQGERPDLPGAAADAGGGKIRVWTNEADGVPIGADGRPEEGLDHWTLFHEWGHVFDDGDRADSLPYELAVLVDAAHRRDAVPEFDQLETVTANGDRWDNLSDTGIGVTQYGDDPSDDPGAQGAPAGNNTEDLADALALWTLQKQQGFIAVDPTTGRRYTYAELFPARAAYFTRTFG